MVYIVSISHWPIEGRGQFRSHSPLSVSLVICRFESESLIDSETPVIQDNPFHPCAHLDRVDGEHDAVLGDAGQRARQARHRQRGRGRQRLVVVGVAHPRSTLTLFHLYGGKFKAAEDSRVVVAASPPRPPSLPDLSDVSNVSRVHTTLPAHYSAPHSLSF